MSMIKNKKGGPGPSSSYTKESASGIAFSSAEEAWFWFMAAYQAQIDGARVQAGVAEIPRPCEPLDILHILSRLYRQRLVLWEHVKILHHYGKRFMPPDPTRPLERRSAKLWREALARLEQRLIARGIVSSDGWVKAALAKQGAS